MATPARMSEHFDASYRTRSRLRHWTYRYHIARIASNLHTVSTYEGKASFSVLFKPGATLVRPELTIPCPFAGTYDVHGLILGRSITGIQAFQ